MLAAAAAVVTTAAIVVAGRGNSPSASIAGPQVVGDDPLTFDSRRTSAYERAAAFGLSHVLFAKSPGGVVASAERTARFRSLVERSVAGTGLDADIVEAIVFLESAGRPEVIAGEDPANASGLTQILAETATNLLGMPVNLVSSRRLTRRIEAAQSRGEMGKVERLFAARRRVDARFDPAEALAGTVRYLAFARRRFGREDLAVVSYHMGIGNLTQVIRAYAGEPNAEIPAIIRERDLSWARLYFDSSPIRHRRAWLRLATLGDDSQTYYWRVLAAREVMRLFRQDSAALDRLARLHGRGPSAERALHPPEATARFATLDELRAASQRGELERLPTDPNKLHFAVSPTIDSAVAPEGREAGAYRRLRPSALRLLRYLAARVHDLSGADAPLTVTRATYDEAYGRRLGIRGPDAASQRLLHETGFAFDIRRRYASGAQRAAFQYTLERLETLGLIAWIRDRSDIHITAASQAGTLRAES
jgi:hypothetical protein